MIVTIANNLCLYRLYHETSSRRSPPVPWTARVRALSRGRLGAVTSPCARAFNSEEECVCVCVWSGGCATAAAILLPDGAFT